MTVNENLFTFLSLGACLRRTFSIFLDRLDIFMTISLVIHLPAIVLNVIIALALAPGSTSDTNSHMDFISDHITSIVVISYSQFILSSLITITGEGGIVRACSDIYCGRTPEWYPSVRLSLQKFLPLVGGSLLYFGAVLVTGSVTLVLAKMCAAGFNSDLVLLFLVMAFLVIVSGVAVLIWITVTFIPLYPVIMIEDRGPINALRRCMELCRGRRGYMFAGVAVLFLAQKILGRFLHAIFNNDDPASLYFAPSGTIITFLPNTLYLPLVTILNTVLYMSVRVDKEGLNQQVLQRELAEPEQYSPPVSDYRQVALVDDRQQPNVVPSMVDEDFA